MYFCGNAVNPNGWKTNPGERYAITFYYKAGNGNPGGMVVETVQAPNTYNGWIDFESVDAGYYELSSCTSSDGWKQGTIIFENRTKVAQYIIFQVNCGIADQPNATVYFDDISVKKLTDEQIYVAFDYRDGRNTSYKIGAVGEALVIPTPTREGYTFDGWYTDAAYTKKFTGTTVPDKSMIVYAKWNINRGQTVTVNIPFSINYHRFIGYGCTCKLLSVCRIGIPSVEGVAFSCGSGYNKRFADSTYFIACVSTVTVIKSNVNLFVGKLFDRDIVKINCCIRLICNTAVDLENNILRNLCSVFENYCALLPTV